jgi:hypothetical protein
VNKTFQVPAIFTGFSSRSDGGASLRFATNELGDVDFAELKRLHNTFGYLLFKANQFSDSDIPEDDAPDEDKTPSMRLRAVLFILWEQRGRKGDFNTFYRNQLEAAINRVKNLLTEDTCRR